MSAIQGTYSNLQYIKTRKVWVIGIEVAEENIEQVTSVLGFPKQGETQWVGIARIDPNIDSSIPQSNYPALPDSSEGEKLRTRAVMLAKNRIFQNFIGAASEEEAAEYIRIKCKIKSRSELAYNTDAQHLFHDILDEMKSAEIEENYRDNLNRA